MSKKTEGEIRVKICSDCLEKGYTLWNEFKYCPICGKELKK
jgi:rRNA maturation endonuclease Nob1